jgi:hypothetical protein
MRAGAQRRIDPSQWNVAALGQVLLGSEEEVQVQAGKAREWWEE